MTKTVSLLAAGMASFFLAIAGVTAAPAAADADYDHCLTPSGVDLNTLLGVDDRIVTRFCAEVGAGDHIRPFGFWGVNTAHEQVPEGYVPSTPTPLGDFVAKLVQVKVVLDGGTRRERTLWFEPSEVLRTDLTLDGLEPGLSPLPMAVTLPRVPPLPVGEHSVQLAWILSAQHCDGLGTSLEDNCLPAGEVPLGTVWLDVNSGSGDR
jgi:hypothetical protein